MMSGQVVCELFGSLALTGHGHATDTAILLGLAGHTPEGVCPDAIAGIVSDIRRTDMLKLADKVDIGFVETRHLLFHIGKFLPGHANAMRFTAAYGDGSEYSETYFSIGGGAIMRADAEAPRLNFELKHPFASGAQLLEIGEAKRPDAWRNRRSQ